MCKTMSKIKYWIFTYTGELHVQKLICTILGGAMRDMMILKHLNFNKHKNR